VRDDVCVRDDGGQQHGVAAGGEGKVPVFA